MKPLRTLLLFCILLGLAGAAGAQINQPHNELGLYTVPDPDGCATAQVDVAAGITFTCYLVLTNPWNEALDRPVANVGGFEFRLGIPSDVYLISDDLPPCPTCFVTPPDYIWPASVPVMDGCCSLVAFHLMSVTDEPRFLSLGPIQDSAQSIPGQMAFTDQDDQYSLQAMRPISGSPDVPVFAVNWDGDLSFCETVPDAGMSFGAFKALYR